jgi:rhodanese-related sulfurtransferase
MESYAGYTPMRWPADMAFAAAVKQLFRKPYGKVTSTEAVALADAGAILLDVREPHEWQAGHAPKARHMPLGQLARRVDELPPGRHIITVCRSGSRSARAAAFLAQGGREVSNLTGGMHAWVRADLPVVAKGGRPGHIG